MAEKTAADPQPQSESLYPAIEAFVEYATADDVVALFGPLKDALTELKGPRAEQAKKVSRAIAATDELLAHLLAVRARLEEERRAGKTSR